MIYRVLRGDLVFDSRYLRSTYRNWVQPERRFRYYGFRLIVRRAE